MPIGIYAHSLQSGISDFASFARSLSDKLDGEHMHHLICTAAEPQLEPKKNTHRIGVYFSLVPGQGFEPQFFGPEPNVLPLDDPGV
jgi:hypothetical protein